jgi:hypothetical protein
MDFCDLDCKIAVFPKSEAVDGSGAEANVGRGLPPYTCTSVA